MSSRSSVISIEEFLSWQDQNNTHPIKTLKVIYTSMAGGPAVLPDIIKQNPNSFIPNSIAFDFQDQFADRSNELSNAMLSAAEFDKQATTIGLRFSDTIVIYDDFGNFCASRVWFMFKSMGHQNVFILDGGLPLYLQMNLPTTNKLLTQSVESQKDKYESVPNASFVFVGQDYILANVESKTDIVADARSKPRYLGITPETKAHLRAGHIPHSVNIHYASLQDDKGRFMPTSTLKEIFAPYSHKPLVFSCGSGVTACILAQAASLAGISQVKVYDGSWSQWGANNDLPIETGE